MLAYQIHLVRVEAERSHGRPRLLPVLTELDDPLPTQARELMAGADRRFHWNVGSSPESLVEEVVTGLESPIQFPKTEERPRFEAPGGAVPLDSPFYVTRPEDARFHSAVADGESIVLIKGARQMGKTSMLARGLQRAREDGHRVILTDFQKLNEASFESLEKFYFALGVSLADQLDLDVLPEDVWDSRRGPNSCLERYLRREVLAKLTSNLVWGMDEIDRLFPCEFSGEVFSLFRSWHNTRALEPSSPWSMLTLAIAYATEVHLFITDLAQSPFNVGTRLELQDFTREQVAQMNELHQRPLKNPSEIDEFISLLGGQPYLVRRGLHDLATGQLSFDDLRQQADREEGVFGDHLGRIAHLVAEDSALVEALREVVAGRPCPTNEVFHRLKSAGIISGPSRAAAQPRCGLYRTFLERTLKPKGN
jgi:hypothetical protein